MKLKKGRIKYKLPKDIYQIISVYVVSTSAKYIHSLLHISERMPINKDVLGHPQFFLVKNGEIYFQPIPDKAITAHVRYTTLKEI